MLAELFGLNANPMDIFCANSEERCLRPTLRSKKSYEDEWGFADLWVDFVRCVLIF
jgi:hypothetical protein